MFPQINDLGLLLKTTGKFPEAEQLYTEGLAGRRQRFGNVHPKTLTSMNNLGALYYAQGRLDEARPLAEEALSGRRELLGDKHPETLQTVRVCVVHNVASWTFGGRWRRKRWKVGAIATSHSPRRVARI